MVAELGLIGFWVEKGAGRMNKGVLALGRLKTGQLIGYTLYKAKPVEKERERGE